QPDFIYKGGIRIDDVLRPLVVEGPNQDGDDPLGDDGIAVRGKVQPVPIELSMYPYPALASLYQVVVRFVPLLYQGQGFSQFDHILIALHPVVEHGEFIYDIVLYFLYCHVQFLCKSTIWELDINSFARESGTTALGQHVLGPFDPLDQKVHLLHGIVKAETGPYRARDPVEIHDGLGTVVSGPHGNAQFVQDGTDIIGMDSLDVEGYHGGFFLGRTIDFKAVDLQ